MGNVAGGVREDEVVYVCVFKRGVGVLVEAVEEEDGTEEGCGCEEEGGGEEAHDWWNWWNIAQWRIGVLGESDGERYFENIECSFFPVNREKELIQILDRGGPWMRISVRIRSSPRDYSCRGKVYLLGNLTRSGTTNQVAHISEYLTGLPMNAHTVMIL